MTKQILMACGHCALVDDADFERLSAHAWHRSENGYVTRRIRTPDGKRTVYLHREVAGWVARDVDHRDGDKLNCTRSNLRPASRTQNNGNMRLRGGSSQFKGVCKHRYPGTWIAYISCNKRRRHLGVFTDERAAAAAYNAAAKACFGEFARLNPV